MCLCYVFCLSVWKSHYSRECVANNPCDCLSAVPVNYWTGLSVTLATECLLVQCPRLRDVRLVVRLCVQGVLYASMLDSLILSPVVNLSSANYLPGWGDIIHWVLSLSAINNGVRITTVWIRGLEARPRSVRLNARWAKVHDDDVDHLMPHCESIN